MTRWLEGTFLSGGLALALLDATVKATIVLVLSLMLARSLRRSSSAARHRLWAVGLCGLLALPVVSCLMPGWSFPIEVAAERVRDPDPGARALALVTA